jgi:4-hydroxybenzoate polyprenyltransferase
MAKEKAWYYMQLMSYISLAHPGRWAKNLVILLPWIFFAPGDIPLLYEFIIATVLFSLLTSSAYCLNDIFDRNEDKNSHIRQSNPLSKNVISVKAAALFASTLALMAFVITFFLNFELFFVFGFYFYISLKYSLLFRNKPYLDIFMVSMIQPIRIVVGLVLLKCFIDVPAYITLMLTAYFFGTYVVTLKRIYEMKGGSIESPRAAYLNKDTSVLSYLAIIQYFLCILSVAAFIYFHESLDACIFAASVIICMTLIMFVRKYSNDSFFRASFKKYLF